MSDSKENQGEGKRDEALRRLLNTPPQPHKPKKDNAKGKGDRRSSDKNP